MMNPTAKKSIGNLIAVYAAAFVMLGVSCAREAYAQAVTVDDVRVTGTTEGSTVVLDLSDAVDYKFFRLGNPERLVLDIFAARVTADAIMPSGFAGTPVLGLRHARRGGNDLRVVVDLAEGMYGTQHFTLPPDLDKNLGFRLVLDIVVLVGDDVATSVVASGEDRLAGESEVGAAERGVLLALPVKEPAGEWVATEAQSRAGNGRSVGNQPSSSRTTLASKTSKKRRSSQQGVSVDFSGTWQHEWAWAIESSSSQKFESVIQPRWDLRFENGLDLTAILRVRADGSGELGPMDRRPPNYSNISAPWFNSGKAEVSLRELFVDFQWGNTDWRLGKQQIVWGQADGIKVLDVVNPQSFREFILDDFDDSRIPLWTANVTVPLGESANLQLLWIPDTTYHELAEPGTPFAFSTPRIVPQVPITGIVEVDKPDNPISDGDAGLAVSGFLGGWDLSLNYLYRYLDIPVLPVNVLAPQSLQLTPEYQRSHLLGGTFSNVFGNVTLRGEFAYNSDTFHATDTLANSAVAESAEFSAVVGLDWAPSGNALLSAQLFNSYLFDFSTAMVRDESEQTMTLLYQQDFVNATWRFRGIGIRSLNDGDSQIQLKLSYWWSGRLQVWVGADVFSGDNAGLFGQFEENDRALLGFEYGF